MLGFRGHFLTKSRAYSTTFKQIREDQRAHRLAETLDQLGIPNDDTTLVINQWTWAGAGYGDDAERELAAGIADRIRDDRRNRHHTNHEQREHAMIKLLSIQELADYLSVPVNTLYQWRTKGYGPAGRRIGKHVRYRESDVEAWVVGLPTEAA